MASKRKIGKFQYVVENPESSSDDTTDETTSIDSSSTIDATSTNSGLTLNRKRGKHGKKRGSNTPKINFKFKQNHKQPLFGVQFNHLIKGDKPCIFATVGHTMVSVYECPEAGGMKLLQTYSDPDKEIFYTCAWSVDKETGESLLAAAGLKGIIRIFVPAKMKSTKHFIGHGSAINELKFHPIDPNLLLSVSKDKTLRLWNIKSGQCIALFGGVHGHRDEIISADFDPLGQRIISSGLDHSIKLWRLDTDKIKEAIAESYFFTPSNARSRPFPTIIEYFPKYTTRDVHRNYIDCVRWFGNFILSKSCENKIVCWKPFRLHTPLAIVNDETISEMDAKAMAVINEFKYQNGNLWFMRFSLDSELKVMALGDGIGQTYVWNLGTADPTRYSLLKHPKCVSAIRQTAFSRNGKVMLCVCDDATIWRWDRVV